MVALPDLVDLLLLVVRGLAMPGVPTTWIVTDGEHYTTRFIYDQLRLAAGKGTAPGWLPRWGGVLPPRCWTGSAPPR